MVGLVKIGRILLVGVLWAGLAVLAGADFPYNGGFEQLDKGLPVGWDVQGTWLSLNPGAYEGKKAIYLAGTVAQAGDRLVSQGYRLAAPGDTLTLHLAYGAAQGGAVVGVQPCDGLGTPLGDKAITVALPAAADWQTVDRDLVLAAGACPAGTAAVRVVLGVGAAGEEVKYDAVRLTCAGACAAPACEVPAIDACARPNLLQNPGFQRAADGTTPGWTMMAAPGAGAPGALAPAGVACAPGTPATGLALVAGAQPVVWLSQGVLVDLSLPYEITLPLPDSCAVAAGRLTVVARLRDPADPQVVWVQAARPLCATDSGELSLTLPRLARTTTAGLADVAVTLAAGSGQSVTLTSAALCPQPVSMGIRPVAGTEQFARPQDVTLFVIATNNTLEALAPVAYMKVFDSTGQVASYEARPLKIGPQSASYFPCKPKLTAPGDYRLLVRLKSNGQDLGSATYAFKVTGGGGG
jgi:hypothetical protein